VAAVHSERGRGCDVPDPVRVIIGEDDVLLREGIARLLTEAVELRRRQPETGVLVLSQYYEEQYAIDLIGDHAGGAGYFLKERVGDVDAFIDAVSRVASGGSALDPEVVARMLGRRGSQGPLAALTTREHEVLAAMAKGKSNQGLTYLRGLAS